MAVPTLQCILGIDDCVNFGIYHNDLVKKFENKEVIFFPRSYDFFADIFLIYRIISKKDLPPESCY